MLSEALSFPTNDDGWLKTVGIGGLLVLGGAIFFIPIFPVYGYLLQTIRAGAFKEKRPPRFDDWERLFVDGAKVFAVMFILVGLPTFLFLILFLISAGIGIMAFSGGGTSSAIGAVGLVVGLITFVLFLVIMFTGYVFPVAILRLALEDDFSAAFDFGEMKRAAFSWSFFVAWLGALAVGLTLGLIATILTFLLVGVFVSFFVQVAVFYMLGWGAGEALDIDPADFPPGPGPAGAGGGSGGPGSHGGQQGQHAPGHQQGGYQQQGQQGPQGQRGNPRGDQYQQGGYEQGRRANQGGSGEHGEQRGDEYSRDYRQFDDRDDDEDRR